MITPAVRPLLSTDTTAAVETLTAALLDDPAWVRVVPEEQPRRAALRVVVGVALREARRHGGGLVAHDRDDVLGVAVWVPPTMYPPSRLRRLTSVPPMLRLAARIGARRLVNLARFGGSLDSVFPIEPVWYLQALGVAPHAQHRGIGTSLVLPVLARADAAGMPCYLETGKPENADYYRRSGFELIEDGHPLFPGGPTMFRMRRPPRP